MNGCNCAVYFCTFYLIVLGLSYIGIAVYFHHDLTLFHVLCLVIFGSLTVILGGIFWGVVCRKKGKT